MMIQSSLLFIAKIWKLLNIHQQEKAKIFAYIVEYYTAMITYGISNTT